MVWLFKGGGFERLEWTKLLKETILFWEGIVKSTIEFCFRNMKNIVLWVLCSVIGAGFIFVFISTDPDMTFTHYGDKMAGTAISRKLKENVYLDDYRPIDPVPNSKASIRHGPIQHGTPLMPYIPKPAPPPKHGGIP